jgi:PAS domain S-box-containing protein
LKQTIIRCIFRRINGATTMNSGKLLLSLAAGFLIFLFDIMVPIGYGIWLFYVVLFYLFITYSDKKNIASLAGLYITLIIIGYFLSSPAMELKYIPIFNRLAASLIIIFFAILGIREKEAKKISAEILERIKDLFIALDKTFHVIFMNKSARKFAGLEEEVQGKDYFELFPDAKNSLFEEAFHKSISSQQSVHFEGEFQTKGEFLDVSVYPSYEGISIFAKDITETVKSERALKRLLQEKEVLLREIHHRTKNNFQLILSLLNLQLGNIQDELSMRILNETRARILSIASLYDKLHLSGNVYTVDMQQFIKEIVVKMDTAANFGIIRMDQEIEVEEMKLKLDVAIPLGLIINELYTNSLKYAFNGNRRGAIKIVMHFEDDDTLYLKYKDNGKGLPEDFNLERHGGLGSSIISSFVEQLDGNISFCNNHGAEFDIRLKIRKPLQQENTIG